MFKRTIAAVIFLALLASVSCGDKTPSDKTNDSNPNGTSADNSGDTTTQSDYEYPVADYEGHEFVFLNVEPQGWANALIAPEETTGDLVSDAMYERNARIEERYNITIREYQESIDGVSSTLRNTVSANDDVYDVCMLPVHTASGILADEYVLDLNTVYSLNLDKPWWDQAVNNSLTIAGKLYMTTSDISFFPFEATWGLYFNEDILEDLGLDMPYDLVREGKWTIDKLTEYAKAGASLDSDDRYEPYDPNAGCRYGIISHHDFPLGLIVGAGESFVKIENSKPVFNADSERMSAIYDKITSLTGEAGTYYDWNFSLTVEGYSEFMKGRSMIWSETLGYLSQLRSMDANFGVLPFPKFDESQDGYHSIIASWGTTMTTIPATASDKERTGVILDALAYDSYKNLMEPYYNTYLMQKGVRNDDSAEMLSIIRNSRVISADLALGWSSDMFNVIRDKLSKGNSAIVSDIASQKNSVLDKANKMLG